MKKIFVVALIVLFQTQGHCTITIQVDAANLKDANGTLMPTTGLVILAASTTDLVFGSPTVTAFFSGDDIELKRWDFSTGTGTPGQFSDFTGSLTFTGSWNANDPLQLYWFPTLTVSASTPGSGTPYGLYRDPTGVDGSAVWTTPADGTLSYNIKFFTQDFNPTAFNISSTGNASLTVVPEPSAYATVFGIVCLIGAVASRRLSKSPLRS